MLTVQNYQRHLQLDKHEKMSNNLIEIKLLKIWWEGKRSFQWRYWTRDIYKPFSTTERINYCDACNMYINHDDAQKT